MARSDRRARRLVIGGQTYLWIVRHRHQGEPGRYTDCREVLSLSRPGVRGRLELVFRAEPGRLVPDGTGPSGVVGKGTDDTELDGHGSWLWLNLHEPGTVRALLDAAAAAGWQPGDPPGRECEVDGWPLFDAAAAGRLPRTS